MNTGAETEESVDLGTSGGSNNPFENFGWEGDTVDSLPQEPVVKKDDKVIKKIKETDPLEGKEVVKATVKKAKTEEEEEGEDLSEHFADFRDDPEEEEEGETKPKPKKAKVEKTETTPAAESEDDEEEDDFYTNLTKELKEKKIFANVEIADDEEITEDRFFELQEEEVDARADELVTGIMAELKADPTVSALIKFVKNGGNSADFLKVYSTAATNVFPEDYDLAKESNQKKVLKHYLKTVEGLDDDDIEERMDYYDSKGKIALNATKFHEKLLENDAKAKLKLAEDNKKAQEKSKLDNEKLATTLAKTVAKGKIGDFTFSAKEQKDLPAMMTKASVKVSEGVYITPFQAKMKDVLSNADHTAILLKLLNNGFDTSDLIKTVNTKVVATAKKTLRDSKTNDKTLSNKGSKISQIADMFN